jgi:ABC-type dipeptide/oligopeptide/nickel transport system permease component
MGTFMLSAVMVIFGNLVADICYGLANPQIRYD